MNILENINARAFLTVRTQLLRHVRTIHLAKLRSLRLRDSVNLAYNIVDCFRLHSRVHSTHAQRSPLPDFRGE